MSHPVRPRVALAAVVLTAAAAGGLAAQTIPTASEQMRLALTAAPPRVSESASVYVLGPGGYEMARPGSNGFHCLVERWEREAITPICYDRVGEASTLRAVFFLEERRAQGVADERIFAELDEGYASGRFQAPAGPGVAYMLSFESPAPPHVMYYAPYATNEAFVGAEGAGRRLLPFIYDPGTPRAYIVQLVDPDALAEAVGRGR